MEDIQTRIVQLERANRRMRWCLLAIAVGVCTTFISQPLTAGAQANRVITTAKLQIVDSRGYDPIRRGCFMLDDCTMLYGVQDISIRDVAVAECVSTGADPDGLRDVRGHPRLQDHR